MTFTAPSPKERSWMNRKLNSVTGPAGRKLRVRLFASAPPDDFPARQTHGIRLTYGRAHRPPEPSFEVQYRGLMCFDKYGHRDVTVAVGPRQNAILANWKLYSFRTTQEPAVIIGDYFQKPHTVCGHDPIRCMAIPILDRIGIKSRLQCRVDYQGSFVPRNFLSIRRWTDRFKDQPALRRCTSPNRGNKNQMTEFEQPMVQVHTILKNPLCRFPK
jgi:hypothetical protein